MKLITLNYDKILELCDREDIPSQAELARRSRWEKGHLNRTFKALERGEVPNVTLDKLDGLCRALQCKASTILVHELDPPD